MFTTKQARASMLGIVAATGFGLAASVAAGQGLGDGVDDPAVLDAAPIGEFGLGLSYGTDTGAAISAHASADGLLRDGHHLGFRVEVGEKAGSASADYRYGPLGGRKGLSFGLGVSAVRMRPGASVGFGIGALSVSPRLIMELSPDTILSPYVSLSAGRVSNVPEESSALLLKDEGRRTMASAGLELQHRLRDDAGKWQTLMSFGLAQCGSDRGHDFTELSFSVEHSRSLGAQEGVKLSAGLSGGTILSASGASHVGDRTILGPSALRGFDFGGIGPRDLAVPGEPTLGGNTYATLRLEARAPDLLGDGARPVPGLFMDAGSLWGLDDRAGGALGADVVDDGFHLRASVGVMVDFRSSFGTLQLSVAQPVERQDYDQRAPVHISFSKDF